MSELAKVIKDIQTAFWAKEFYIDGGAAIPNSIVTCCSEVVGRRLKSPDGFSWAGSIITQLAKANMPIDLFDLEVYTMLERPDWRSFLGDFIDNSLCKHLEKDLRMRQASERRERLYS